MIAGDTRGKAWLKLTSTPLLPRIVLSSSPLMIKPVGDSFRVGFLPLSFLEKHDTMPCSQEIYIHAQCVISFYYWQGSGSRAAGAQDVDARTLWKAIVVKPVGCWCGWKSILTNLSLAVCMSSPKNT